VTKISVILSTGVCPQPDGCNTASRFGKGFRQVLDMPQGSTKTQ